MRGACLSQNPQPLRLAFCLATAHDFSVRAALFRGLCSSAVEGRKAVWEAVLQSTTRGGSDGSQPMVSQLAAGLGSGRSAASKSRSVSGEPQGTVGTVSCILSSSLRSNRHTAELEIPVTYRKQRLGNFLIATFRTFSWVVVFRFFGPSSAPGIPVS